MHQTCPHCGAVLPAVKDAFCGSCGEPLDGPSDPSPPPSLRIEKPAPGPSPLRYALAVMIFFALMAGLLVLLFAERLFPDKPPDPGPRSPRVVPGRQADPADPK